jgi:di/tricarboxylate transporter
VTNVVLTVIILVVILVSQIAFAAVMEVKNPVETILAFAVAVLAILATLSVGIGLIAIGSEHAEQRKRLFLLYGGWAIVLAVLLLLCLWWIMNGPDCSTPGCRYD